ncbi:MAG: efflux RND transporter periplasmic adaptor subunit [Planctomycetes bacterium]|nr:efflux RND transporter periplasmic adaptor subunit [Planctomycetota bacterium]
MKPKRMNPQLEALRIEHHLRPRPRDRSRSTVSRLLVFLCVPAGLAICGWVAGGGWNQSASAMPPANQSPAVHDAKHGLMAGGKIVSDHTVMVATKVSGQVVELWVEQGERVQRGQRLARIEDDEYRALRDMHSARLREAEAELTKSRHDYKRTVGLRERKVASDTEWVAAEAALGGAEARVAAARAGLTLADKRLSDCGVTSPIAGVVLETHVSAGDFVAVEGGRGGRANGLIVTVADVDHLRVEVDVSEQDIARIRPAMPCTIIPDAYPDRRYSGSLGEHIHIIGVLNREQGVDQRLRTYCVA